MFPYRHIVTFARFVRKAASLDRFAVFSGLNRPENPSNRTKSARFTDKSIKSDNIARVFSDSGFLSLVLEGRYLNGCFSALKARKRHHLSAIMASRASPGAHAQGWMGTSAGARAPPPLKVDADGLDGRLRDHPSSPSAYGYYRVGLPQACKPGEATRSGGPSPAPPGHLFARTRAKRYPVSGVSRPPGGLETTRPGRPFLLVARTCYFWQKGLWGGPLGLPSVLSARNNTFSLPSKKGPALAASGARARPRPGPYPLGACVRPELSGLTIRRPLEGLLCTRVTLARRWGPRAPPP